jgi:hypothetical protein
MPQIVPRAAFHGSHFQNFGPRAQNSSSSVRPYRRAPSVPKFCPNTGRKRAAPAGMCESAPVLDPTDLAQRRLESLLGLSPTEASRAVAEVLDCFDLTVDDYIARCHAALQRAGVDNEAVYSRIADDLRRLRFRAAPLTARQIRRRIYG